MELKEKEKLLPLLNILISAACLYQKHNLKPQAMAKRVKSQEDFPSPKEIVSAPEPRGYGGKYEVG